MRAATSSDIYFFCDPEKVNAKKITATIKNPNSIAILNDELSSTLDLIKKMYKDHITLEMITAVKKGDIIIYYTDDRALMLPVYMPFVKVKGANGFKVRIDVSNFTTVQTDRDSGNKSYSVNEKKLYAVLISGYLTLVSFSQQSVLHPEIMGISASIWGDLFCNILNKATTISKNKDAYLTIKYLAMKFFLIYIMELNDVVAVKVIESVMGKEKSQYLIDIENKLSTMDINPYVSLTDFCKTIFNYEITSIQALRSTNRKAIINVSSFVAKYGLSYGQSTLLSLGSYSYFVYSIISAFTWSGLCNSAAMQDIIFSKENDTKRLLALLFNTGVNR